MKRRIFAGGLAGTIERYARPRIIPKGHRCDECDRLGEAVVPCGMVEDGHYQTYELCPECREKLGAWVELEF